MRNLEQIRAKNALEAASGKNFRGANDGEVVKKIPAMIRENGLLGALAFAAEAKEEKGQVKLKNPGHADVFRAIIRHLSDAKTIDRELELDGFVKDLCVSDAARLRAVTAEAMAYLNYLRRFARKTKEENNDAQSEP